MTTYKIDKPEKGAGLIEYFLKYLTLFIIVGFLVWAILIISMTSGVLVESTYMISLFISFGLSLVLIFYLVDKEIKKNKQGTIYRIDFNEKKQLVSLHLINEFTGHEFLVAIQYSDLSMDEKSQKIDVKAEQRLKIYNNLKLINVLNIPKTEWTVHPRIALIVETFREIENNKK